MGMLKGFLKRDLDGENRWERVLFFVVVWSGVLLSALPLYWMVRTAVMFRADIFNMPIHLFPPQITLRSFVELWQFPFMTRQFLNTLIIIFLSAANALLVNTPAAYALARMRFHGRNVIFFVFVVTILLPAQISIVPLFLIVRRLGLYDTYWGVILPLSSSGFFIFLLRQFFLSIPTELEDAGLIDGCNRLQVLWHIILPVSRPALAVVALVSMVFQADNYLWPLIITKSEEMRPAAVTVPKLLGNELNPGGANPAQLQAALLVLTVPVIIFTLFGMDAFVRGVTTGALKG